MNLISKISKLIKLIRNFWHYGPIDAVQMAIHTNPVLYFVVYPPEVELPEEQ